jgi:UDP-glucose 4-epimerase
MDPTRQVFSTPLGNTITLSFFDEIKCDITGSKVAAYTVSFIDAENGVIAYKTTITTNHWTSPNPKYMILWHVIVEEDGEVCLDYTMNFKGKNIWIELDSKALGDTIAWMPYAEEFRIKHDCEVFIATYHNELFKESYPNLNFQTPVTGDQFPIYAMYKIGCFDNNYSRNKNHWRTTALQQTATDVLGLDYKEVRPRLVQSKLGRPIPEKYVVISEFSTFQGKFWNRPGAWQELVDYLNDLGLKVMCVSKEPTSLKNVIKMNGRTIDETLRNIQYTEFIVTIASGLSWMAWGLDVPVVIISGFTDPISEMKDCIRIINKNVCYGCYNDTTHPFDRGNWNWCPRNKKFECSVTITVDQVKKAIKPLIENSIGLIKTEYEMLPDLYGGCKIYTRDGEVGKRDDKHVANMILQHDEYRLSCLKKCIRAPRTIFDVGGHIGTFSMKSKMTWPDSKIYAYEPNKISIELFRKNLTANNMTNWEVFTKGIAYDKDRVTLVEDLASTGGGVLVKDGMWDPINNKLLIPCFNQNATYAPSSRQVVLATLEEEMEANNVLYIDILKLDCETSEIDIIKDMEPSTAKKIGMLIGEYHVQGGYEVMKQLILDKFPWFEVAPVNPPQPFVGDFIAGPPEMIAKWYKAVDGTLLPSEEYHDAPIISKYKIKLVHLLSNPQDPCEKRSISSLSQLKQYGIEYIQHNNGYETKLPDAAPLYPTGQFGQPLKPGHYGCWNANRRAITEEFTEDLDFIITCERDVQLALPPEEFMQKLIRCLDAATQARVNYMSLGYKQSALTGVMQSPETAPISDDIYFTNKIIGLHCLVFPQRIRQYLQEQYKTTPWYGADIWYNDVFWRLNDPRMAIVNERMINTEDGWVSMIDGPREIREEVHHVDMLTNVLVTGGAGFIGSHLVDKLVDLGLEVSVIDDLSTGKRDNVNPKAKFYMVDITNRHELELRFMEIKPDIVFHLAAKVSVKESMEFPEKTLNTNVIGSLLVLEAAKLVHAKRFVFVSSGGAVYGESVDAVEFDLVHPSTIYGQSKWTFEQCLRMLPGDMEVVILRPSNVYGPRQSSSPESGVVAIFTDRISKNQPITIYGKNEQADAGCIRDYVYVDDVVSALELSLKLPPGTYNISTGVATSTLKVMDTIADILQVTPKSSVAPPRSEDVKRSTLDSNKLKEFGWNANVNLFDGLSKLCVTTITPERILYLAHHCSTGGMPQYMVQCVEKALAAGHTVEVAQYADIAPIYAVQKNKIEALCPFHTLGGDKLGDLVQILLDYKPTLVHMQELPEIWMPDDMATYLYRPERKYKIIETSHTSDIVTKKYRPDSFSFVSKFHVEKYGHLDIPMKIVQYDAGHHSRSDRTKALESLGLDPNIKHVLNVGLFTKNKNQGQIFRIARLCPNIQFHFVGNQAMNFEDYWSPLMKDKPENCIVWGERSDVEKFYGSMDVLLFTSLWELSPIVIREALAYAMPVLMYELSSYCGEYDGVPNIHYLKQDTDEYIAKELQSLLT